MPQSDTLEESDSIAYRAQELVERTHLNIFLTGKAGTGKTTFLRKLVERNFKPMLVCAPTGIAALNAGGVTLHSMMGIPPCTFVPGAMPSAMPYGLRIENPSTLVKNLSLSSLKRIQIKRAALMVIDEVSMLRADMLDAIDQILKFIRHSREPFGGMQMLFVGDLMQLPPVIKIEEWNLLSQYYPSPYFFDAKVLRDHAPLRIDLKKVYRQKDEEFAAMLNRMRAQQLTNEDVEILNRHYTPGYSRKALPGVVTLTTHNRVADTINQEALQALNTPLIQLSATIQGEFPESMFPCERDMKIKPGAQVMFIKNDLQQPSRFYNGKMGVVEGFEEEQVKIRLEDKSCVLLEPHLWENVRYTIDTATGVPVAETIGRFLQYPLRLAWAITIHKSQGLTFEKAAIDVQNVFASGQCYVAFSRLRSLNGLTLITPFQKKELNADRQLLSYEGQPSQAETYFSRMDELKKTYFIKNLEKIIAFSAIKKPFSRTAEQSSIMKSLMAAVQKDVLAGMDELLLEGRNLLSEIDVNAALSTAVLSDWLSSGRQWLKNSLARLVNMHQSIPEPSSLWLHFAEELEHGMGELWQDFSFIESLGTKAENGDGISRLKEWIQYRAQCNITSAAVKKKERKTVKKSEIKKPANPTRKITLQFIREGKTIKDIAAQRNLTETTIASHVSDLIKGGELQIEEVLPLKRIMELAGVIQQKPAEESLWQYHQRAYGDTSFSELKWVDTYLVKHNLVAGK